jgi:hypothetical protein
LPVKPGVHCCGSVDGLLFPKAQLARKPVKNAAFVGMAGGRRSDGSNLWCIHRT